jgi:hypothetical protein
MKGALRIGIVAAAIALPALSSAAWAGGTDDFGCSNATLKGEYAFGGIAYTPAVLPNGPPAVFAGIRVYDGNGHFTQRDYQGDNLAGPDFAPPGQETGTYTVNPDCTGSDELDLNVPVPSGSTGVIKTLFVISDRGRHVHEAVSELTPPGSTTGPAPTQTSADVWKVDSEQEQRMAHWSEGSKRSIRARRLGPSGLVTAPSVCLNLTLWAALGEKPGCRVKLPRRTKKDSRSRMASEIANLRKSSCQSISYVLLVGQKSDCLCSASRQCTARHYCVFL